MDADRLPWGVVLRRISLFLLACALSLAFTATASANLLDVIVADYADDGRLNACKYTPKQLQTLKGLIPNDLAAYDAGFAPAVDDALARRAEGACNKKKAQSAARARPRAAGRAAARRAPPPASAGGTGGEAPAHAPARRRARARPPPSSRRRRPTAQPTPAPAVIAADDRSRSPRARPTPRPTRPSRSSRSRSSPACSRSPA